jgi:uncharacterized damage-inducible protein DinB
MDVRDLVRYNHNVRRLYFKALSKLPWSEVVRHRDASFECMRNIFIHLTIVEDRWINYIIPDRFKDWVDPQFDKFKDFNTLKGFMLRVEEMTENYLKKLTPQELSRKIVIPWGDVPDTRISIETALSHMVIEDLIHYGELSDLLWQINSEPPYLAFWRYIHNITNKNKTSRC